MESARSSVTVKLPVDDAHQRWAEYTGQQGSAPSGGSATQEVPAEQMPAEADKGQAYFTDKGDGSTEITMELLYNPTALKEAGRDHDWVVQRIGGYLGRFREFAEKR